MYASSVDRLETRDFMRVQASVNAVDAYSEGSCEGRKIHTLFGPRPVALRIGSVAILSAGYSADYTGYYPRSSMLACRYKGTLINLRRKLRRRLLGQ